MAKPKSDNQERAEIIRRWRESRRDSVIEAALKIAQIEVEGRGHIAPDAVYRRLEREIQSFNYASEVLKLVPAEPRVTSL